MSDAVATSWNTPVVGNVYALAVAGTVVYAGGLFTINGLPGANLVSLSASSGTALTWNPNPDAEVATLAASGSAVYVGGSFLTLGSTARQGIAAFTP
jgi:hypothetical protein